MRKKDPKKVAEDFVSSVDEIREFVNIAGLSQKHVTWVHEYAIIRLYREFEAMILNCLIAAINRDASELSKKKRIDFPKHLNVGVCEYIIVGDGYFNFRGRDGLRDELKKFVQNDHYLVNIVSNSNYIASLNRLSAFRNFAAHDSKRSKKAALKAASGNDQYRQRMPPPGVWLKTQGRFDELCDKLEQLANEIINYHRNQEIQ